MENLRVEEVSWGGDGYVHRVVEGVEVEGDEWLE